VGDWGATLDGALALDFDTVIPGHGPLGKKADVAKFRDNMRTLATRMTGMVRDGKTQPDVAKMLTTEFGWADAAAGRSATGLINEFKR
jgi:hypothetical protein